MIKVLKGEKKMKKIILAMLAALLIFGLVGCGSENASAPEETSMDEASSDISNDNITVPNEEEKEIPKEIAEKPRDEPGETVQEIPEKPAETIVAENEKVPPEKPAETIVAENEEVPPAMQEGQAPPQDGSVPPERDVDGPVGPGRPGQDGRQMIDTAAAAEQLGVSEEALINALGDAEKGPPDLAAAAYELGITEEELQQALGLPE